MVNSIIVSIIVIITLFRLFYQAEKINIINILLWSFYFLWAFKIRIYFPIYVRPFFPLLITFCQALLSFYCYLKSKSKYNRLVEFSLFLFLFAYIQGFRSIALIPQFSIILAILLINEKYSAPIVLTNVQCIGLLPQERKIQLTKAVTKLYQATKAVKKRKNNILSNKGNIMYSNVKEYQEQRISK